MNFDHIFKAFVSPFFFCIAILPVIPSRRTKVHLTFLAPAAATKHYTLQWPQSVTARVTVSPALWCVLLLTMSIWNHKKLYASYRIFPSSDTILRYTRLFVCVSFLSLSFPSPCNYYTRTATQATSYSACADHIWGLPNESQGGLITVGIKQQTKWRCTGADRHVWVAPPTERSFLIPRLTLVSGDQED